MDIFDNIFFESGIKDWRPMLLLTCKTVYWEAITILDRYTTFHLHIKAERDCMAIDTGDDHCTIRNAKLLTHIQRLR